MKRTFPLRAALLATASLLALLPASVPVRADDAVETIVVKASRGTQLNDMDVSTTVVTRDQIQSAPQTTVDQILGTIPGINISAAEGIMHPTGQGQSLNMRGFGNSTNIMTLVMVDGVPVNDTYFKTVDWSQIPKDSIERIEIIRGGGATSIWGNMATGGVINIVTRFPDTDKTHYNLSGGSFATVSGDLSRGVALDDQFKIGLSYDGSTSNGYNMSPKKISSGIFSILTPASLATNYAASAPTGTTTHNGKLSLDFTPDNDSHYNLSFLAHQTSEVNQEWQDQNVDQDIYRLTLTGMTKTSAASSLNLNAWGDFGSTTFQNTGGPNTVPLSLIRMNETVNDNSAGGSVDWRADFGNFHDIKIGVDARNLSADNSSRITTAYASKFVAGTSFPYTFSSSGTQTFEGLFAQGTYRPGFIPLDLTLGLREDLWQTRDLTSSSYSNIPQQSYAHFDPRLGAKYYITDNFNLRGAVYENFAAPSMNQMYRTFISGGSAFWLENPNLKPETNRGWELGADTHWQGFSLSGTFFYNSLDNYIDYAQCGTVGVQGACAFPASLGRILKSGDQVKQYLNVGNAVIRGFEFMGGYKVATTLDVNAGVTFTKAYLTSNALGGTAFGAEGANGSVTGLQLGQVPPWIFTAGAKWRPIEDLTLSAQLKAIPKYWDSLCQSNACGNQDGGTIVADLGASYKIRTGIEVYGSILNVANTQYIDNYSSGDPVLAPPLTVMVGIRGDF